MMKYAVLILLTIFFIAFYMAALWIYSRYVLKTEKKLDELFRKRKRFK